MTASTRFIGLAVFAWAGVRAVSLGLVPGSGVLAIDRPAAAATSSLPPIAQTEFAPIDPPGAEAAAPPGTFAGEPWGAPRGVPVAAGVLPRPAARYPAYRAYPAYAAYAADPADDAYLPAYGGVRVPLGQSTARVRLARAEAALPPPRRVAFGSAPLTTALPPARVASADPLAVPGAGEFAPPAVRRARRLDMTAWAMMRGKPGDLLGSNSLAANSGTLGGSQAGARLNYWITPHLAASLRSSAAIGGARGGEVAAGLRYRPWVGLPLAITAERRQRFGRTGGRNDFALFVEGGIWDRPIAAGFRLDAYAQAGVVGIRSHDLFTDGAFTLTRPLWRNVSGGFGMWGGAQPHLYRVDAGPRLTVALARGMRVHLDYRQRLLGTASPSSGPAVTLAGDF